MNEYDLDALWRDAEIASCSREPDLTKQDYMLDALLVPQDGVDPEDVLQGLESGERVVRLADGDFHVCKGCSCEFVTMDSEKNLICSITGMQVGTEGVCEFDARWTGRSTTSANPDDVGGTPVGGWVKRRDMFNASRNAYLQAETFKDHEPKYEECFPKERKTAPKRGALCVDEVRVDSPAKRTRVSKKTALSPETRRKMQMEASSVIVKLITRIHGTSSKSRGVGASDIKAQAEAAAASTGNEKAPDPRLQNVDFVKGAALKRMFKNYRTVNNTPSMDDVHNLFVYVNSFVKVQRSLAKEYNDRLRAGLVVKGDTNFSYRNQQLSACHITNLWEACCMTPYIAHNSKSSDSFRPFASGVLYTLKRGLKLRNGVEIIPCLPELASQLPCLRSQQATPAAKQLQSSSHRGVCSLHRSISSIDHAAPEEREHIYEAFAKAARSGDSLRRNVRGR